MPFNLAQWTGIAVAVIVVSGSDIDVVYAVPMGLFAGAFATFFCAACERRQWLRDRYAAPPAVPANAPKAKKSR